MTQPSSFDPARLELDIQLARRAQLSLLPKELPRAPGLDLWAATRAAFHVGGDFYDFIERPDGTVIIVVGDIAGKGVAAALFVAATRRVLRTQASWRTAPTPATILRYANAELYGDFTNSIMLATVFIGQYAPSQNVLTYSSAGHSPVIFRPAGGEARVLLADGTAFGVLPHSIATDQHITLQPGDVFVIGTDGLNETRSGSDRLFGYYGLKRTVDATAHLPAHAIGVELFAAVDHHGAPAAQQDDQTLVVLKYTGAGDP